MGVSQVLGEDHYKRMLLVTVGKDPSLLNGHECGAFVKIFSSSPVMVKAPHEWKILKLDNKPQTNKQTYYNIILVYNIHTYFIHLLNIKLIKNTISMFETNAMLGRKVPGWTALGSNGAFPFVSDPAFWACIQLFAVYITTTHQLTCFVI